MKYKPVEGCYDGEYKQGEPLDLSVFPDEVRNEVDDNWGEVIDFSIEEMLDMPVMGDEIGEAKNLIGKEQSPNYSDFADNESHDENDLELVDVEDLY